MPDRFRWSDAVSIPWNVFVVAFLYYVGLSLCVLGIADLPGALVAIAYTLPLALYLVLLMSRAVRALARLPIAIGHTPHAIIH